MSCTAFHYPTSDPPAATALRLLPDPFRRWFTERFGQPTAVQRLSWAALTQAPHVLLSAPTGTGKTLAAFTPILADLLTRPVADGWADTPLRALYVAPLKARWSTTPREVWRHRRDLAAHVAADASLPRLAVRTGDTSPADRRLLRDDPPDVLLTTPESLAVLLSLGTSSVLFANLRWVVVDEVHALVGNKRGADLAVCLERLARLAGAEPRRVGLSATATPLDIAARWLVGTDRPCTVVRAPETPPPLLTLEPLPDDMTFLAALADRLVPELPKHRAVLVFTNTRGLAERLAWVLRRRLPAWDDRIAVHHSALAPQRRRAVEEAFKHGELRVVVSSTSLELGIDIGTVDLAVLVHPPGDVIRLLQRVGRAGHEPNGRRRGLVLAANGGELLEATVTAASGRAGQCEPLQLPAAPLDVLCQQILGMCAARSWPADELFELVRRAAPYAELTRADFDDCLAYLRGVDQHGEPWLPARLIEDGDCWRIASAATARLLRRNLGSILAEPTVAVQLLSTAATGDPLDDSMVSFAIGEVDESFADQLQPGDRFLLDGRCLEFRRREHDDVFVEQLVGRPRVPTWTGDGWPLSPELARRLYVLRLQAAEALRDGPAALAALFRDDYQLTPAAVASLADYFERQESISEIPDVHTLLIEEVRVDAGAEYYLHTPLNRPGNDALARVLAARLAKEVGRSAMSTVADLGLTIRLRTPLPDVAAAVRTLLRADGFAAELADALAGSDVVRSRFGRVARTGLMVLRNPLGRRRRVGGIDWPQRQLFEQVRGHDPDFVLLRQALNEVRRELCDEAAALAFVTLLPRLTVVCRRLTRPSPFAQRWTQVEEGIADRPRSPTEALAQLHAELTGGAADAGAG
ncbi:MAG: DEAD/DEAH box helicase [Gemmataceae bacterium]